MAPIWALIIGIANYQHPDTESIKGPHVDVEKTSQYLREDEHVPPENICILKDETATRKNIIDTFRRHLIENKQIQKGDAILFHFSGHGSQSPAPEGWPVLDNGDGGCGLQETILPYDESMPDDLGDPICGIPDRTLGALLSAVAENHGENITVVLDCCHSGHGTRSEGSPYSVRGVDPKKVTPLRSDVDRDIWGSSTEGSAIVGERSRGGFTDQRAKSHVLIAACGQKETAMGTADGGILTSLWLQALRDPGIKPRSYSQLMKVVCAGVDKFQKHPKWPEGVKQHPQCEGITRHRTVFQKTSTDHQFFEVEEASDDNLKCRISAGEIQGVGIGTTFELYKVDSSSANGLQTLGTAVARLVYPTHCLAEIASVMQLAGCIHLARISSQVYPLRYMITSTEPSSPDTLKVLQKIEGSLRGMKPETARVVQRVSNPDEADLVLEVDGRDGGGVTLQRRDAILRDINTSSPRLNVRDIFDLDADFASILNSIARFNHYLSHNSDSHPFSEVVEFEFHLLEDIPDSYSSPDTVSRKHRGRKKEILPENDELKIQQVDTDDYAFVLRNSSEDPLYVYLVYFDTGTYEISVWYSPANPDESTLLSGGELQIGESAEHADPFSFFVRKGDEIDTSFIKVFITDNPTQLLFMEQNPQIGVDENGRRYSRFKRANDTDPGVETQPRKGRWDCLTRKITVRANSK